MNRLLAVLCIVLFVVSCGRKGPPRPPEDFAPQQVVGFDARGDVEGVLLSWSAPTKTANGDALVDLAEFEIRRAIEEDGEFERPDTIATVPFIDIQKPDGSAHIFTWRDRKVTPGIRYRYDAVAVNDSGTEGTASPPLLVTFRGNSTQVQR